jgi:hypothetical protein
MPAPRALLRRCCKNGIWLVEAIQRDVDLAPWRHRIGTGIEPLPGSLRHCTLPGSRRLVPASDTCICIILAAKIFSQAQFAYPQAQKRGQATRP